MRFPRHGCHLLPWVCVCVCGGGGGDIYPNIPGGGMACISSIIVLSQIINKYSYNYVFTDVTTVLKEKYWKKQEFGTNECNTAFLDADVLF